MEEGVILQVDVTVRGRVNRTGSRSSFHTLMRKRASVLAREATGAEAPVAVSAEWGPDEAPGKLAWREFDGALWRPVLGFDAQPLGVGGFQDAVLSTDTPAGRKAAGEWVDYPFKGHPTGDAYDGVNAFNSWRTDDPEIRVRESDEAEAVRLAQVRAAEDILVVDGVVHVRSVPPVWSVGCERAWWSPGEVRLTMPDFARHVPGAATFPLDRLEDAMDFAAERVATVTAHPLYERLGHPAVPRVERDGSSVTNDLREVPDTRASDRARIAGWVESNMRNAELRMFDRGFIKAYGDFLVTAAGTDDVAAAAAVAALAEAGDPEWVTRWPMAFDCIESVRVLAQRDAFDAARAALREDADAFVGPGL